MNDQHPQLAASCRVAFAAFLHDLGKFAERVCNQHNAVYYLHKSTAVHNERAYVKQPEVAFYTDKNIHTKRNKRTHNGNNRACFCRA